MKIIFVPILLAFVATTTLAATEDKKAKPETTTETKQAAPKSTIPEDYYQQLGFPPLNRPWAPNDYLQAATVLTPVAQRNPKYLPNYMEKFAIPYIDHMVDGRNLFEVLSFASTTEQRIELIMVYLDGIQRLLAIYQQALNKSLPFYAEWLDLIALSSYLAALSAPEWQHYLAPQSLDPHMLQNEQDKQAAAAILQTAMVNPVITGIQVIPRLSPPIAWRLIKELNYSLPVYATTLPLDAQQQLYEASLLAMQNVKDPQLREGLQKIALLFNKVN